MDKVELKTLFDQQAAGYDRQWARMAPLRDCLYFLLESILADLPERARILSVGCGTGAELSQLARRFPLWRFTAVDPSGAMLRACQERAGAEGFDSRCDFHEGYVDSLPSAESHDAATCFLVSQFMLEPETRTSFFADIASRLKPGGILVSADLASDAGSAAYESLSRAWFRLMSQAAAEPEVVDRWRAAYDKDVAILPPGRVAALIEAAGYGAPVQFYQAGLIHAWFARTRQGRVN